MRSSDIDSSHNSPSRIIPHRGKVSKHSVESSNSKHWAVLHEDVAWSNFANDSGKLTPESGTLSFNACSFPGDTDVLAGESPTDDIDFSPPRFSVEGAHVVPDRESR
jgi:hypothetical protein